MCTTAGSRSDAASSPRGGACWPCGSGHWIDALFVAAGLVWGALVLLGLSSGLTARLVGWDNWSVFFTGLAVLVLAGVLIREIARIPPRPQVGALLLALFLLALGVGERAVWIWAVLLAALALAIVRSAFQRHEGVSSPGARAPCCCPCD